MYLTTKQIKKKFIHFFCKKKHINKTNTEIVQQNDPTLLFINAGMVPFKEFFLDDITTHQDIVSIQKCIRVGGKQSDLNNVGKTKFHHTFFEMLGNFSFGNYFKETAIKNAWEFLTKILKINITNLYVTIHTDDTETYKIWKNTIGLFENQIIKKKTNFWSMGSVGPCGPCSEIFYTEHNITKNDNINFYKNSVELWNLVFIQYNKTISKQIETLKKKSIDTGMGIERVAFVLQKKKNTYETDLFKNVFKKIQNLVLENNYNEELCYKIIDHLRCCIVMIDKNIIPDNVGKSYILRKLIQKIFLYTEQMHLNENFIKKLITASLKDLKQTNIEVTKPKNYITEIFEKEQKTNQIKNKKNTQLINTLLNNKKKINGKILFKLYETHGLKIEQFTHSINDKKTIIEFNELLKKNQEKNRVLTKEKTKYNLILNIKTNFVGYIKNITNTTILHIIKNNKNTNNLEQGQHGAILLKDTPFFTENGGQKGDIGIIKKKKHIFIVKETKITNNLHLHTGFMLKGSLKVGDVCTAKIDKKHRNLISINHTATHLLNAVLKKVIGAQITQKGSLISEEKLRYDFTHNKKIEKTQLNEIENIINNIIQTNSKVKTSIDQNNFRTITIGKNISTELCCGTHVKNLKEIFFLKITTECSIAENTRRIEALTNLLAIKYLSQDSQVLEKIIGTLHTTKHNLLYKINQITKKVGIQKSIKNFEKKTIYTIKNTKIMVIESVLKENEKSIILLDKYKNALNIDLLLFICDKENKIEMIIFNKSKQQNINAAELIKQTTEIYKGSGGGTKILSRGGFTKKEKNSIDIKEHFFTIIEKIL